MGEFKNVFTDAEKAEKTAQFMVRVSRSSGGSLTIEKARAMVAEAAKQDRLKPRGTSSATYAEVAESYRANGWTVPSGIAEKAGEVTKEERAEAWAELNLPETYQAVEPDFDGAKGCAWIWKFGEVGHGKTYWACKIAKGAVGLGKNVVFTTEQGLFDVLYAPYSPERSRQVERVMGCGLLVVDDAGHQRLTEAAVARWLEIVDERQKNARRTLFTSQTKLGDWLSAAEIANPPAGKALRSRLKAVAVQKSAGNVDYRAQQSPML